MFSPWILFWCLPKLCTQKFQHAKRSYKYCWFFTSKFFPSTSLNTKQWQGEGRGNIYPGYLKSTHEILASKQASFNYCRILKKKLFELSWMWNDGLCAVCSAPHLSKLLDLKSVIASRQGNGKFRPCIPYLLTLINYTKWNSSFSYQVYKFMFPKKFYPSVCN